MDKLKEKKTSRIKRISQGNGHRICKQIQKR